MTIDPVAPLGGPSPLVASVASVACCPSCGVSSHGSGQFCLSCGKRLGVLRALEGQVTPTRLNPPVVARVGSGPPAPEGRRPRLGRVSVTAGILILIAVAGALVAALINSGPTLSQQPAGVVVVLFGILAWAAVMVIALALCATAAAGDRKIVDERAELLRAGLERRRVASLISTRSR